MRLFKTICLTRENAVVTHSLVRRVLLTGTGPAGAEGQESEAVGGLA